MKLTQLKDKIKYLVVQVIREQEKSNMAAEIYDELTKFPELKQVIVELLTSDFDKFVGEIDWVAPKPSTFRINLLNGESFLLIYNTDDWIAEVSGKKYDLSNVNEEQRAINAISRLLIHGGQKEEIESPTVEDAESLPNEEPLSSEDDLNNTNDTIDDLLDAELDKI